jgi:hypothetical protein
MLIAELRLPSLCVGLCALTLTLAACDNPGTAEPGPGTVADPTTGAGPATAGASEDTGAEQPLAQAQVEIAVASVQLIQDCPDPDPVPAADVEPPAPAAPMPGAPAKPMEAAQRERSAKRGPGSGPMRQPCTQSTVQLSLTSHADEPVAIALRAVRLLSEDQQVGTLAPRLPTRWVDSVYVAWDAQLEPGATAKVSYKLGMPDWGAVEDAIDGPSYRHMFILEIDVVVAGELQTIRSSPVPREQPHVIVT